MLQKNQKGFALIPLVILSTIVGIIIGLAAPHYIRQNWMIQPQQPPAPSFQKANDLRVDLNAALRENVALVMTAARRVYDNDIYASDAIQALSANADDIAKIIGDIYGPSVKEEYSTLWKNQDTYFINFAKALRENDQLQKEQAERDLDNYDEETVKFWRKHNPKLDLDNYQQLVIDRVSFIKSGIEAYSSRNIAKSYKQQHNSYQQIGKVADILAEAIVKQFPEKFNQ